MPPGSSLCAYVLPAQAVSSLPDLLGHPSLKDIYLTCIANGAGTLIYRAERLPFVPIAKVRLGYWTSCEPASTMGYSRKFEPRLPYTRSLFRALRAVVHHQGGIYLRGDDSTHGKTLG